MATKYSSETNINIGYGGGIYATKEATVSRKEQLKNKYLKLRREAIDNGATAAVKAWDAAIDELDDMFCDWREEILEKSLTT